MKVEAVPGIKLEANDWYWGLDVIRLINYLPNIAKAPARINVIEVPKMKDN